MKIILLVMVLLLIARPQTAYSAAIDGAPVWRSQCAQCHGADGRGTRQLRELKPNGYIDFTTPAAAINMTRKRMLLAVRDGASDGLMPSFRQQLNYQQLVDVVDYARETFVLNAQTGKEHQLGKQVYADNCSVCHGDQGQVAAFARGGLFPAPANFTAPKVQKKLSRQRMIFSVTNGRPETAMVSWQQRLGDNKIAAAVDYIRAAIMKIDDSDDSTFGSAMGQGQNSNDPFLSASKFSKAAQTIASTSTQQAQDQQENAPDPFLTSGAYDVKEDPNLKQQDIYSGAAHEHNAHMADTKSLSDPLPEGLVGNYFSGKKLYQDNCTACHGSEGNGKGPRAYFIFPKPRNFTHTAARASFSRAHIYERIRGGVNGTEMPAWGQVLEQQQMANIAEYVFSTFISPEPTPPSLTEKEKEKEKEKENEQVQATN